jgi:hypothetical protein
MLYIGLVASGRQLASTAYKYGVAALFALFCSSLLARSFGKVCEEKKLVLKRK